MYQAPLTLSPQQRSALESAYIFFSGATPFLQSIENKLAPDERLQAHNLRDLAGMTGRKLLLAFPEINEFLSQWEHPGGVA
jgi:hypothetical protein